MAGQLNFEGNITAGPPSASDAGVFPSGVDTVALASTPSPKSYTRHEHKTIDIAAATNQPLDFTNISATFVYLRSDQAITFRINGGVEDIDLLGTFIIESPPGTPITAITVSGTAQLEYLVAGDA